MESVQSKKPMFEAVLIDTHEPQFKPVFKRWSHTFVYQVKNNLKEFCPTTIFEVEEGIEKLFDSFIQPHLSLGEPNDFISAHIRNTDCHHTEYFYAPQRISFYNPQQFFNKMTDMVKCQCPLLEMGK